MMKQVILLCMMMSVLGTLSSSAAAIAATRLPDKVRANQVQDMKWGMFICWSFSTFSGQEWTPTKGKDATYFKATGCDTDQWCRTAKEAGMGYILFLSKHHDGFCLWDTKTTEKKVTNSPLGIDVLAKLRKSCDKYGIKLALYFSEGDWNWPGAVDGKGRQGGTHPEMKKAQLKELLTQYGPIEFWWMDHAVGTGGLSHQETVDYMHQFQPNTFVGFNHGEPAGRLCLREMGRPGKLGDKDATKYNKEAEGSFSGYHVAEFTYPILPKHKGGAMWFYSLPIHDQLCHPAAKLYNDYRGAVEHGNIFSINIGPNYEGKIRDIDVKTLKEVGTMIRKGGSAPQQSAPSPDRQDASFRIEMKKTEDSATVSTSPGSAIVSIASQSGIGGAKLFRTGLSWPARISINLNLKGLESLSMDNGRIHLSTFLKGPKRVSYWIGNKSPSRNSEPAGSLDLELTQTGSAIELVVPGELTAGNPEVITLGWIDFFRG